MKTLRLSKRLDQVAVITFDAPSSVNVLSRESMGELQLALDEVFKDAKIRACIVTSAKKDCFLAGADLDGIAAITTAKAAEELSRGAQEVFNRIANGPIPFVAAIQGVALGGGLELALACHLRIAVDDPKTVFALPEVQLGLLPGAGGTQRLPRLIGLRQALPLVLTGNRVRPKKALGIGLIDGIAPASELLEVAAKKALSLAEKINWKGLVARSRLSLVDRALMLPIVRGILLSQTRKQVYRKTRGKYPAPLAILKCMEVGLSQGQAMSRGLAKEAELFGALVVSPEAKNLVWIFHASTELKKLPREAKEAYAVRKLSVIGAGLMGQGIASVSLPLSAVVLKDVSDKTLAKAKESILSQLAKRVKGGSLIEADQKKQEERLVCVTENTELAGSELVIEAVFEELELKRKILADVEKNVAPTAVFASNTSALPISQIAAGAKNPERVLGMHYFSPVPKMPLLEIIVTPQTSEPALMTAQAYGIAQGKTVIVVKDGPGFYTTRILAPLLNEGMLLLEEGAAIKTVDQAMKKFGFPVGPIVLLDEVGIDVGVHVAHDLGKAFGQRWGAPSSALDRIRQAGFLGKKNGKGFYDAKKEENTAIYGLLGNPARKQMDEKEMAERVALMMVNEAVYCLQEQVIRCPRDGDIGAIMGLGFPPFLGGPFHYLDSLGIANATNRLREFAKKFGPRFAPAPLLEKMERSSERFYPV